MNTNFLPPAGPRIHIAKVGYLVMERTFYPEDVPGHMNPTVLQPYLDRLNETSVSADHVSDGPLVELYVDKGYKYFSGNEWKQILTEIEELCKASRICYWRNDELYNTLFGPC